jgi:hypothetical protein
LLFCAPRGDEAAELFRALFLRDQAAAEADGNRVGARAGLELCQQVPHVGLHSLFREEEPLADLPVDEPVGNELKHFELAARRLLLELLHRACERNYLSAAVASALLCDRLETARMVAVAVQDLVTLGSVHDWAIGRGLNTL